MKDTEVNQREILKMIKNLSSKINSLSDKTSLTTTARVAEPSSTEPGPFSQREDIYELPQNQCQHMVTGVSPQTEIPPRSSSLPPPNQKYPDHIVDKLFESLQNVTQQNIGLPKLPKALSTTMPTFNGKNNEFEHFEDLFMTSHRRGANSLLPLPTQG